MSIIDLIFQIDYIGNLLDNVDYFVQEDINELQRYIINKFNLMKFKRKKYDDCNHISIKEENERMEKFISEQKKILKMNIKEKEKNIDKKEEVDENLFGSKKDIIFLEEDLNEFKDNYEIEYKKNTAQKEEDFLPFFKALHTS